MLVTEQRLHHRQIHPRLGHRSAERMPQRMWMPRRHTSFHPVVPEDGAQPGRGQGLARLAPLATTNNREHAVSGLSASR